MSEAELDEAVATAHALPREAVAHHAAEVTAGEVTRVLAARARAAGQPVATP